MKCRCLVLLVGLAASEGACTQRAPLTGEIRESLEPGDFQNLQCYTSHEITLKRGMKTEERDVTAGHILRIENAKRVEVVVIPQFTPGVVVKAKENDLMVSFEPPSGGKELFLTFRLQKKWSRSAYYYRPDQVEVELDNVTYGGKTYTSSGESLWAFLMIDESRASTKTKNTREVPGRRIESSPR